VPTSDDAAFTAALNSAGAGYVAASQAHVAQRTGYAGAQNLSSLAYVIQELMSATNVNNLI
jgi:heptaprenylglyceryl phosphate synthase